MADLRRRLSGNRYAEITCAARGGKCQPKYAVRIGANQDAEQTVRTRRGIASNWRVMIFSRLVTLFNRLSSHRTEQPWFRISRGNHYPDN